MRRNGQAEQWALAEALRADGKTWVEIAKELRQRWPELSPRAALRIAHRWTQRQAAAEWTARFEPPKDARDFSLWETASKGRRPGWDTLTKMAELYQCSVADLVTDFSDFRHLDEAHGHTVAGTDPRQEDDVDRRSLMRLLGGAAAAVTVEPDKLSAALDTTTVSETRLAYLETSAAGLGVQAVQVPPHELAEPVAAQFRSVRQLIEHRQTTSNQTRLVRVAAQLGTIMGELFWNTGDVPNAERWYLTAKHAAQDIGDQYLADIALAGLTYPPAYGDPFGVLALVEPRLAQNPWPTPAIAWLWGFAARAHARLGHRDRFWSCIEQCSITLDNSPSEMIRPGIFSFVPEKLHFYTAAGCAQLGLADEASQAATQAMELYDPSETTEPALVQLDHATALVHAGEQDQAAHVAIDAITQPNVFMARSVTTRATELTALMDPEMPAVQQWIETQAHVRANA